MNKNFNEFSSWLSKQGQFNFSLKKKKENPHLVGIKVESRLGIERLKQKIQKYNEDSDFEFLAAQFKKNGGTITEVNDLLIKIQVNDDCFSLPKIYTKKIN